MHCPGCNMPIDEEGAFCGHCGEQLQTARSPYAPAYTRVPPVAQKIGHVRPVVQKQNIIMSEKSVQQVLSSVAVKSPFSMHAGSKTPLPMGNRPTPVPAPLSTRSAPVPAQALRPVSGTGRNMVFLAIILTILLVGVLAGALTLLQHKTIPSRYEQNAMSDGVRGSVSFSDGQEQPGTTSNLNISVNGLKSLTGGGRYVAWMVDEETEHVTLLGVLKQEGSVYRLKFQQNNTNLLSVGNGLEITQETAQTTLPTGHIILSAHLPTEALVHIKHLLLSFPATPGNMALLVGLRGQAQQLYNQIHLLKNVKDENIIRCIAQSVVNLIEGSHSVRAHPLDPICATKHIMQVDDGYGLLGNNNNGYVAATAMHASLAATQPDTTDTIRTHAQQVINATDNLRVWLDAIDQDAQSLERNPINAGGIQEMSELSGQVLNGIDLNHDGRIDSIKGEAGVNNAYLDGQAMADLTLLPVA